MSGEKTICLIDGSGYIFRAFYALPPITRPDGTPVGAVFGFSKMLMNLIQDNHCDLMVVVFDAKRKNFRNDIYPEYKANRRETPPELIPQFPLIRAATNAFGVPWIEMEGFEADDLIATYARLATERGYHARVISADKDLMQLMSETVSLYDPMKRKELTADDVMQKFGVLPDKVVDVQSLMGDSTDNIPGAQGVGPKTAAKLINQFGSLDYLLSHLDEIESPKQRDRLKEETDLIRLSQKLVSLDKYAPVSENLDAFIVKKPDKEKLTEFLIQNDFKSLLSSIGAFVDQRRLNAGAKTASFSPKTDPVLIQSADALKNWIQEALNTSRIYLVPALSNNQLSGIGMALDADKMVYIPLSQKKPAAAMADLFSTPESEHQLDKQTVLNLLKPVLDNPNIFKTGMDMKSLMHLFGMDFKPVDDVVLMSYALDGMSHAFDLKTLVKTHLKKEIELSSTHEAVGYVGQQLFWMIQLADTLSAQLNGTSMGRLYYREDIPLISILFQMEQAGILVDPLHLLKLQKKLETNIQSLTGQIYTLADEEFNINSPAQLGHILFEKQQASGGKKGIKGHYLTDSEILEQLADDGNQLAARVLEYRACTKLKNTYVDALLKLAPLDKNRIHCTFAQTATNTGRLACSNPNLQNIPVRTVLGKEIRASFVARKGYKLLCADYSQIELRLIADVANVPALKTAFLQGDDIHAITASTVFGIPLNELDADTRRRAKAINFGIIYGISAFGLARQLGISRAEAAGYIKTYFEKYPEIRSYMERTIDFAKKNGFVLTPFGRRCYIKGLDAQRTRGFAERAAINAPIQGGGADIIKKAMIQVAHALAQQSFDITLLLQVHDELIFEVADKDVDAAAQLIKSTMEQVVQLSVPLVASVGTGKNWKEAH